ncbi:MAG: hypothetical protein A2787_05190 [Omnitrophica WOR_2 bacterium RIFCSPHIGHO2_01_FULL_48_9]|nr:MAG: hypothetical protein A3D10_08990 [Omnitrophica WOR_2 bacterium RIFCSPHIGHO2_02_FULL_48_11]OGX34007.1 MAG: hypothetical protein A2787_05190 [Omnitrophica WOR_2 bacterium RIFCSPHIGHO2_01_FULL_48_9]
MNIQYNRGKQIFANKLHSEIFLTVFFACFIPTLFTTVSLFYLIFSITADQIGIPEAIFANIIPAAYRVALILCIGLPLVILGILVVAHKITHKIVGPFDRVVRELDESIKGRRNAPIKLREGDKFAPLVDKINILLERLSKSYG